MPWDGFSRNCGKGLAIGFELQSGGVFKNSPRTTAFPFTVFSSFGSSAFAIDPNSATQVSEKFETLGH
jgi:hypothetical protein